MAEIIHCTRQEYDERPEDRSSDVKEFIESPLKYLDVVVNKEYPKKETDTMRLGSLLHQFVLENKIIEGLHYLVWRGSTRNGAKWDLFKDTCENQGLPYLVVNSKKNELALILKQIKAIKRCKFAMKLIEQTAVREQCIVWEQQGVACKSLMDMLCGCGPIADFKSSAHTDGDKFFWSVKDFGYHYSAHFYEMGRDALWDSSMVYPFYWITVANTGWIHCRVWEMQDELRDVARMQLNAKLQHLKYCRETNDWSDPELDKEHVLRVSDYYLEKNGLGLISG